MTQEATSVTTGGEDAALAAPPDDQNPALIDAEHTLVIMIIGAALFIGAVFVFILL